MTMLFSSWIKYSQICDSVDYSNCNTLQTVYSCRCRNYFFTWTWDCQCQKLEMTSSRSWFTLAKSRPMLLLWYEFQVFENTSVIYGFIPFSEFLNGWYFIYYKCILIGFIVSVGEGEWGKKFCFYSSFLFFLIQHHFYLYHYVNNI